MDGGGHTPSDFPLVALTRPRSTSCGRTSPTCCRASPLQEGFYFHAQVDTDAYVVQQTVELRGAVDAGRAAPGRAGGARPARAAAGVVPPAAGRPDRAGDRGRGRRCRGGRRRATGGGGRGGTSARPGSTSRGRADAAGRAGPRTASGRCVVLTLHHIATDGWSAPLLVRELLAHYAPDAEPPRPPRSRPYRRYHEWLATRDHEAARAAWRDRAGRRRRADAAARHRLRRRDGRGRSAPSSSPVDAAARACARAHDLTLNTLVQGAWGLLLGRLTGREDVVFGTTVSGRRPRWTASAAMIGLFVNTLPVRMRWRPGQPARDVLARRAGRAVRADRPPPRRAGRAAAPGRAGGAVRHAAGVRELPARREPAPTRPGTVEVAGVTGVRHRPLPAGADRGPRRAADDPPGVRRAPGWPARRSHGSARA